MAFILWIAAIIVGIFGILNLLGGHLLWGLLLIIVACALGPGGWTVYRGRP